VVLVWGWPGIGKSTLIRNLSNFCVERHIFKDGAIFINISQISSVDELIILLIESFTRSYENSFNKSQSLRSMNPSKLIAMLNSRLCNIQKSFLLVIDNANDLIKMKDPQFPKLIN